MHATPLMLAETGARFMEVPQMLAPMPPEPPLGGRIDQACARTPANCP